MNIADFKKIEDDLVPNTPLKLPFEIKLISVGKDNIEATLKSNKKVFYYLVMMLVVGSIMPVLFERSVSSLIISVVGFLVMLIFIVIPIYWSANRHTKKTIEILNKIPDGSVVLTFDNKHLRVCDDFSKTKRLIKIDDVIDFKFVLPPKSTYGYIDIRHKQNGTKEWLKRLFAGCSLYHLYVEIEGDKYLLSNYEVVVLLSQMLDDLKANPTLTQIPFSRKYFINGYK